MLCCNKREAARKSASPRQAGEVRRPTFVDGVIDQKAEQVASREVPAFVPELGELQQPSSCNNLIKARLPDHHKHFACTRVMDTVLPQSHNERPGEDSPTTSPYKSEAWDASSRNVPGVIHKFAAL